MLLLTASGAAAGHALTGLALLHESYPLFLLARFVTGVLEGNVAVARALLADRLEGPLRLRAMSWLNGAAYLGWLVGPLLAGFTLAWGVTTPFWIAVVALLSVAAVVAVVLPKDAASQATTSWWEVARHRHSLNLLRHDELRMVFIVQLGFTCGITAFYEYYPLWLVEQLAYAARGIAWVTAGLCALMTATSVFAGGPSKFEPLRRAAWYAMGVALAVGLVAVGNGWVGLAAIVLCGLPNALYNAVLQGWCAERFGAHGQGTVMGLLSTTFCLANIMMAVAGALLTLIDTRLILLMGALLTGWAGWRIRGWQHQLAMPAAATTVAAP